METASACVCMQGPLCQHMLTSCIWRHSPTIYVSTLFESSALSCALQTPSRYSISPNHLLNAMAAYMRVLYGTHIWICIHLYTCMHMLLDLDPYASMLEHACCARCPLGCLWPVMLCQQARRKCRRLP